LFVKGGGDFEAEPTWKQIEAQSFRAALFADPESSSFNASLDTESSPTWRFHNV
jgi:hypothetical protein